MLYARDTWGQRVKSKDRGNSKLWFGCQYRWDFSREAPPTWRQQTIAIIITTFPTLNKHRYLFNYDTLEFKNPRKSQRRLKKIKNWDSLCRSPLSSGTLHTSHLPTFLFSLSLSSLNLLPNTLFSLCTSLWFFGPSLLCFLLYKLCRAPPLLTLFHFLSYPPSA